MHPIIPGILEGQTPPGSILRQPVRLTRAPPGRYGARRWAPAAWTCTCWCPGRDRRGQRCSRRGRSGRAHCPGSSKSAPGGGGALHPEGPSRGPPARSTAASAPGGCRPGAREPGVARAGTEAAVPAAGRGSAGPSRG